LLSGNQIVPSPIIKPRVAFLLISNIFLKTDLNSFFRAEAQIHLSQKKKRAEQDLGLCPPRRFAR
jgi:hypothetical protein